MIAISKRRSFHLFICLMLLGLLCRYSASCADAVRAALRLCLHSVLPSLFPFFAASSLAISCGLAQALGAWFSGPVRRLFHLPACASAVLFLGFLGGYPSGARLAAECWRGGLCSREEAGQIAAVCNNTGPAFLIGMCGVGLFGSLKTGLFLYGIHIGSAVLTAVLLRPRTAPPPSARREQSAELPAFSPMLVRSVLSAGQSCLQISAFVLFFSVLLRLFRETGLLPALTALFAPCLYRVGLTGSGSAALLTGVLELTQGLAGLTESAGTLRARLTAVSALCALGGVSVWFQTAAAAEGLPLRACVRGKLTHAAISAALCAVLSRFGGL